MLVKIIHSPAKLIRAVSAGCVLGVIAGLSTAQVVVSDYPEETSVSDVTTGVRILYPSTPADSLQIAIPSLQAVQMLASASDLPGAGGWQAMVVGGASLTLSRLDLGEDAGGFGVSIDGGKTMDMVFFDASVVMDVEPDPKSQTLEITINDLPVGAISYAGAETMTLGGLASGIVDIYTWALENTPEANPSAMGVASGFTVPVAESLKDMRLSRGADLVWSNGQQIPAQQVWDAAVAQLGDRAQRLALKDTVFLDWENGDDAFDGSSVDGKVSRAKGPKKTWAAAKRALKAGGILVIHGNNGIYADPSPFTDVPADVTIIPVGDMMIGTQGDIDALFAQGRWKMTPSGPVSVPIPVTIPTRISNPDSTNDYEN